MGLVGLMAVGAVVWIVVGVALRRLLVPWEAIAGAAAAAERVRHARHLHVRRGLGGRVGLHVREGGRVDAGVLPAVLAAREAAVAAVGAASGTRRRRGRQGEAVGATVGGRSALRPVGVLRPGLRGRRRSLARRRVRQRPDFGLRRRDGHAAVRRASLRLLLDPVAEQLVMHSL